MCTIECDSFEIYRIVKRLCVSNGKGRMCTIECDSFEIYRIVKKLCVSNGKGRMCTIECDSFEISRNVKRLSGKGMHAGSGGQPPSRRYTTEESDPLLDF